MADPNPFNTDSVWMPDWCRAEWRRRVADWGGA